MACKFSCLLNFSQAVKEKEVILFYLDVHDVYTIKYKTNEQRELLLLIKWTVSKQVLVTVELCSTISIKCFSSVGSVINGKQMFLKLRDAYRFQTISDYDILCIITVIPHIDPKTSRIREEKDFKGDILMHTDCQAEESFGQEWDCLQRNFEEDQRKSEYLKSAVKTVPLKENHMRELSMAECDRTSEATECLSTNSMEMLPNIVSMTSASDREFSRNSEAESPKCNARVIALPSSGMASNESLVRRSTFQELTDDRKVSSSENVSGNLDNNEVITAQIATKSDYFVMLLDITDCILQSLQKMVVTLCHKIQLMQWRSTKTNEVEKEMTSTENLNSSEII